MAAGGLSWFLSRRMQLCEQFLFLGPHMQLVPDARVGQQSVPHSSVFCCLPATLGKFKFEKELAELTEVYTQREGLLFPLPLSPQIL